MKNKTKSNPDRYDFDELEFKKLVNKYLKEEYTQAQAQYLAYQEMGEKVPDEIAKEVRDEVHLALCLKSANGACLYTYSECVTVLFMALESL